MKYLTQLHQTMTAIITTVPGLLWKVHNYTARKVHKDRSHRLTPASTDPSEHTTSYREDTMSVPPPSSKANTVDLSEG